MRIMGILVILTLIAFATGCKPFGALILVFLIGCGAVGIADSIVNGTFDTSKQRERQWSKNPESVVADFEAWKEAREERRRSRPGYAERRAEMDELIRKCNSTKQARKDTNEASTQDHSLDGRSFAVRGHPNLSAAATSPTQPPAATNPEGS